MSNSESPKSFSIGVLFFPYYQWLDAAGAIDYLNNHSRFILEALKAPEDLIAKTFSIEWHYLSSTGTFDPIVASSGPLQTPSTTFKTCPPLDYLLVPGPDPYQNISEECTEFIKSRFPELKGLLTVCTGSMIIARTGVLDGFRVATNKFMLRRAAEQGMLDRFGTGVKWVGDRRFVVDGKVWSGAGVTAGIDLAAEFARVHSDTDVVKFAQEISEYVPNPDHPDPFAYMTEGVL